MEFKFNVNEVLKKPIVEISQSLIPPAFNGDRRMLCDTVTKVSNIIDAMGDASAAAQGLSKAITNAEKLRSLDQTVYLLVDKYAKDGKGVVTGMLKTGKKSLYIFDKNGIHYKVTPLCVLDFYIHESRQRTGLGKQLFDYMLQKENVEPINLAIDRPSQKLLSFLEKHYHLKNANHQMNNFVVYDGFFPKSEEMHAASEIESNKISESPIDSPIQTLRSANGLQHVTSNYGRYGAPRPPCSMGQIIHNTTSVQSNEATGVSQVPAFLPQQAQSPQNNYSQIPSNVTQIQGQTYYKTQQQYTQVPQYQNQNMQTQQGYSQSSMPADPVQQAHYLNAHQQIMMPEVQQSPRMTAPAAAMQQPTVMGDQPQQTMASQYYQQAPSVAQMEQPTMIGDQSQQAIGYQYYQQAPSVAQMEQPTMIGDQLQQAMAPQYYQQVPPVAQMEQPTMIGDQPQQAIGYQYYQQAPSVAQMEQPTMIGDQPQQAMAPLYYQQVPPVAQMEQPTMIGDQPQQAMRSQYYQQEPSIAQMQQPTDMGDQPQRVMASQYYHQVPSVAQMEQLTIMGDQPQQTVKSEYYHLASHQIQQPTMMGDQPHQTSCYYQQGASVNQTHQPGDQTMTSQNCQQVAQSVPMQVTSSIQMQQPISPNYYTQQHTGTEIQQSSAELPQTKTSNVETDSYPPQGKLENLTWPRAEIPQPSEEQIMTPRKQEQQAESQSSPSHFAMQQPIISHAQFQQPEMSNLCMQSKTHNTVTFDTNTVQPSSKPSTPRYALSTDIHQPSTPRVQPSSKPSTPRYAYSTDIIQPSTQPATPRYTQMQNPVMSEIQMPQVTIQSVPYLPSTTPRNDISPITSNAQTSYISQQSPYSNTQASMQNFQQNRHYSSQQQSQSEQQLSHTQKMLEPLRATTPKLIPIPRALKYRPKRGNDGLSPVRCVIGVNNPDSKPYCASQYFNDAYQLPKQSTPNTHSVSQPNANIANKSQYHSNGKYHFSKKHAQSIHHAVPQQTPETSTKTSSSSPRLQTPYTQAHQNLPNTIYPQYIQPPNTEQPCINQQTVLHREYVKPPNTEQPFTNLPSLVMPTRPVAPAKYQYYDSIQGNYVQAHTALPKVESTLHQSCNPSGDIQVSQNMVNQYNIANSPSEACKNNTFLNAKVTLTTKNSDDTASGISKFLTRTPRTPRNNGLYEHEMIITPNPHEDESGQMLNSHGQSTTGGEIQTPSESPTQSPKLERPRSLTIQCSEDLNENVKHGKNEVHLEVHFEKAKHGDNIANDVLKLDLSENDVKINGDEEDQDDTDRSKSPNPLTAQGFMDLKFYHSRLW